jgi:hypothetical protein
MKVATDAQVLGSQTGGDETYMRNLTRALAAVSPGDESVLLLDQPLAEDRLAGLEQMHRIVLRQNLFRRIPVSIPLAVARERVDVLHAQYVGPPLCTAPVVVSIHDISFERYPQFFTDGDAGLTGDPLDAEALAGAMARVLGDTALGAHLSQRRLQRATTFSWEATARTILGVYHTVTGISRSAQPYRPRSFVEADVSCLDRSMTGSQRQRGVVQITIRQRIASMNPSGSRCAALAALRMPAILLNPGVVGWMLGRAQFKERRACASRTYCLAKSRSPVADRT